MMIKYQVTIHSDCIFFIITEHNISMSINWYAVNMRTSKRNILLSAITMHKRYEFTDCERS